MMAFYTFTSGTLAKSSEVNANFSFLKDLNFLNYTGTDLNISISHNSTDTKTLELSDINNATDLIEIILVGNYYLGSRSTSTAMRRASVNLKIESKPIGGSYSTVQNTTTIAQIGTSEYGGSASGGNDLAGKLYYPVIYTLSNDEKTNGIKIKFTTSASTDNETSCFAQFNVERILVKKIY
jgi:hypothetical protein